MTARGRHPKKPRMRLSAKENAIADHATFVLWASNADYQAYVDERHRLLALGWEKEAAEGEALRVVNSTKTDNQDDR